jgi:hypothetical protein
MMNEEQNKNSSTYPVWLYMLMSLSIPVYGFFYFTMIKDRHPKRAKISLLFTFVGMFFWLTVFWLSF